MIEAIDLVKQFDEFTAVQGVSFNVRPGELLALLGPNGAGKTTTIRMISSILRPTSGRAYVAGYDVVTEPHKVRHRIGMLTEQPGLYERMTGIEYLLFFGRLYGLEDEAIEASGRAQFEQFAMPDAADRRIGEYSKGMKQKVGLIRAMLHKPDVLMLDEPTSAMDPYSAKMVREAIQALRDDQRAIVLCTHNLTEAEKLADRIAIIGSGQIIALGTPTELKRQLLGNPRLELVVDRPLNGQVADLETAFGEKIKVESVDGAHLYFRTAEPQVTNPQLVHFLTGLGVGVVTLQEVTQSLEDVYLQVVGVTDPEEEAA